MPSSFGSCTKAAYQYTIYATYAPMEQPIELAPQGLIGNPYMFTGRRFDLETGLYYYRARYYNPQIGRFLQTDPAYSSINLYAYCGNNPLNFVDPFGDTEKLTCPVYATHLITHYMWGEGEYLWYVGDLPWSLVSNDDIVCQEIVRQMTPHIQEWAKMADPKDPCNLKPNGSFGFTVPVQFNPRESFVKFLINRCQIQIVGYWERIVDANGLTIGIEVDAQYHLRDTADFHLTRHPLEDGIGLYITEWMWNVELRWGSKVAAGAVGGTGWIWNIPKAQPYSFCISSPWTNTRWAYNSKNGAVWVTDSWLK
jgi:RHS repeat-associated protein